MRVQSIGINSAVSRNDKQNKTSFKATVPQFLKAVNDCSAVTPQIKGELVSLVQVVIDVAKRLGRDVEFEFLTKNTSAEDLGLSGQVATKWSKMDEAFGFEEEIPIKRDQLYRVLGVLQENRQLPENSWTFLKATPQDVIPQ